VVAYTMTIKNKRVQNKISLHFALQLSNHNINETRVEK